MALFRLSNAQDGLPPMALAERAVELERRQAAQRLIVASLVAIYVIGGWSAGWIPLREPAFLQAVAGTFLLWSVGLFAATRRWPGIYPWRRYAAMAADYAGIAIVLTYGERAALPVFAVLLWVTIGYGMRYGLRYLALAASAALVVVGLTAWFNGYWRDDPYLVLTMLLTTLVVPAYSSHLLRMARRADEAAIAAHREKALLLAQASHDLRQPVQAMALLTDNLKSTALDADQTKLVNNIERSQHSVSQLFRSLLDASSLDSGGVAPKFAAVHLDDLIASLIRQNAAAAVWSGCELRRASTANVVRSDPDLLRTTLQNLVSNAIKYAPGGAVLIGCRRRGGAISIEVYDQGPGIGEQHISKLFDPFYRAQPQDGPFVEGVGLGLSIVSRLAALLGLSVSVKSKPGSGSVFAIDGLRPVRAADGP